VRRPALIINPPERRWVCTRCDHTHVTHDSRPHTPFHPCRGLAGLTSPMTPEGQQVNVTVREREDYIGDEAVTRDGEGHPIMAINVEREDGNDVTVFAPMAKVAMDE
jgi:hypothetical protein